MAMTLHPLPEDHPIQSSTVSTVKDILVRLRTQQHTTFSTDERNLLIGCEIGLNNCLVVGASDAELLSVCEKCIDVISSYADTRLNLLRIADAACWDLFRKLTLRDEVIEE